MHARNLRERARAVWLQMVCVKAHHTVGSLAPFLAAFLARGLRAQLLLTSYVICSLV